MKAIALITTGALILLSGCKRIETEEVQTREAGQEELPNTSTDVSAIQGDTMSVEMATGMDTTNVQGGSVGSAGKK